MSSFNYFPVIPSVMEKPNQAEKIGPCNRADPTVKIKVCEQAAT